jgi:hypothetical protein
MIRVQQWIKERSAALEAEMAALEGKQMVSAALMIATFSCQLQCSSWQSVALCATC